MIPGMEDVISLLYINQYYLQKTYDVIIVDCAPHRRVLEIPRHAVHSGMVHQEGVQSGAQSSQG